MTASKNKMDYISRYKVDNYDRINLQVKKGVRELYRKAANEAGQSLNSWIVDAADDKLKKLLTR